MHKFSEVNFLDIEENSEYIDLVERVIGQAFKKENVDKINLYINIILTNPENIKRINKEYRNIDKETDVLSFPMFEKNELDNKIKNKDFEYEDVLGDIVISIERVKGQAEEYGHSFEREFSYMIVHGFYHLMGYDHIEEQDKVIMRPKEEKILDKLGIRRDDMNEK